MFEKFTPEARRILVIAQEQARTLNHHYVGSEHILLGLLAENDGIAAQALRNLAVSLDGARNQVLQLVPRDDQPPGGHIPFTPQAKRALEFSLRESKRLRHTHIGTEHILLGIAAQEDSSAATVLVGLGAALDRVRAEVLRLLGNES
jgi:ATP-dependent Clp protease ATP-binding subunit ClpC